MDYSDVIYSARYCFPVITALFFVIKLFGGTSVDRKHSLILCFLCVLYFMAPEININQSKELYKAAYLEAIFIEILITGAGMMMMFMLVPFDKKAFSHALILVFIIVINFMLNYHYTISPQYFFKNYFDELIIIASVSQIMVSYDGFTRSISSIVEYFRRAQDYIGYAFLDGLCWIRNIQIHIKSRGRS
jgi:hypothetical protein